MAEQHLRKSAENPFFIIKKATAKRVMSLAENFHFHKSASIAFVWTNAVWAEPKPL